MSSLLFVFAVASLPKRRVTEEGIANARKGHGEIKIARTLRGLWPFLNLNAESPFELRGHCPNALRLPSRLVIRLLSGHG